MDCVIKFLNQNSGAITAFATFTLACATIILVIITYCYARSTNLMAETVEKQFKAEQKRKQEEQTNMLHNLLLETERNLYVFSAMKDSQMSRLVGLDTHVWDSYRFNIHLIPRDVLAVASKAYDKMFRYHSFYRETIDTNIYDSQVAANLQKDQFLKELYQDLETLQLKLRNPPLVI